jgi:hypothetical protein
MTEAPAVRDSCTKVFRSAPRSELHAGLQSGPSVGQFGLHDFLDLKAVMDPAAWLGRAVASGGDWQLTSCFRIAPANAVRLRC